MTGLPPQLPDAVAINESGCWVWQNHTLNGYGHVTWRGVNALAHRVVFELTHGPIPAGHHLHHLCGTRPCVNPEHLTPMDPVEHQHLHFQQETCRAGHAFTEANTYLRRDGGRVCRRCKADRQNAWYREHSQEDIARRTENRRRARTRVGSTA